MDAGTDGNDETPSPGDARQRTAAKRGLVRAAGLLFGDWGTSRLYVLGLAFLVAGRTSFWLIAGDEPADPRGRLGVHADLPDLSRRRRRLHGRAAIAAAARRRRGAAAVRRLHGHRIAVSAWMRFTTSASAQQSAQVAAGTRCRRRHRHAIRSQAARGRSSTRRSPIWHWKSPALWAIVVDRRHRRVQPDGARSTPPGFAIFAAAGMVAITLMVRGLRAAADRLARICDLGTHAVSRRRRCGRRSSSIVLALSGVEAIANLTGVMKKPVYAHGAARHLGRRGARWRCSTCSSRLRCCAIFPLGREAHTEDMLAFMAGHLRRRAGRMAGAHPRRAPAAVGDEHRGQRPDVRARTSWRATASCRSSSRSSTASARRGSARSSRRRCRSLVLLFCHDLETLAHLYAIGVVGAVAINCSLTRLPPAPAQIAAQAADGC